MWDAPGMQRIKIPAGGLNAGQLETLAELAEEYSDGIAHITTRQDVQLHYIHIDDTPSLMRRLAAAGITTREACGNSVRNVTACPYAGVCQDESFDMYVGGGLGAVPYQAKLFESFIPAEELLPLAQAIARVFARLGEKKNRSRARLKFLVQDLGIEKFRQLVLDERRVLPFDARWTEYIAEALKSEESALSPGGELPELV